jgi:hypothetical protein
MAKREVNFPHTIGFRLSDEAWFKIEQEVANTNLTPHDWCRMVVLKTLDQEYGFSSTRPSWPSLGKARATSKISAATDETRGRLCMVTSDESGTAVGL